MAVAVSLWLMPFSTTNLLSFWATVVPNQNVWEEIGLKLWVPGTLMKVTPSIQLCDTLPWPIFCCYLEAVEEGWCCLVVPQPLCVCPYLCLCLRQGWTRLLRSFASAPLCQVSEPKLTVSWIFSCLILMLVDFKGSCTMFLSNRPEAEKQENSPNHFL